MKRAKQFVTNFALGFVDESHESPWRKPRKLRKSTFRTFPRRFGLVSAGALGGSLGDVVISGITSGQDRVLGLGSATCVQSKWWENAKWNRSGFSYIVRNKLMCLFWCNNELLDDVCGQFAILKWMWQFLIKPRVHFFSCSPLPSNTEALVSEVLAFSIFYSFTSGFNCDTYIM